MYYESKKKKNSALDLPGLQQQTLGHAHSLEANKQGECFHSEHTQQ